MTNIDTQTPLHAAIMALEVEVARYLLEHGADANARRFDDLTPLQIIIRNLTSQNKDASCEIIRLLVSHGADVQTIFTGYPCGRQTLMSLSASNDHLDMVQFLAAHGARLEEGLLVARSREIARFLLERGADPHVRDEEENTPLHHTPSRELIALLLDHGIPVDARNRNGETPLYCVLTYHRRTAAMDPLLAAGADPLAGAPKRYPLYAAVARNRPDLVQKILPNLQDVSLAPHNLSLLEAAAERDAADCIRLLMPQGVRPGGPFPARKKTPLHIAAGKNAISLLRLCLESGADPNIQDNTGSMPLHLAAKKNLPDICRLLLDYGADRQIKDRNGKTPQEIAQEKNKRRALAVL